MRKGRIAAVAFGVLIAIAAWRVADILRERGQVLQSAEARADNLALILAAYIGESFRAADASLRQLQFHSRRVGGPQAPADDWTPSLISARAGLTGVGAITVIDAAGIIRHSTRTEIVGQSRRNEYLTRRIASATDDELVVGTPFPTLASPASPSQLIIPIGRRLVRADGGYDGSVAASFRPEAPRTLLRAVNIGARGAITVFHPEGVVLFREPAAVDATGQPALDNPIFVAARRGNGTLSMPLEPGGPVVLTVVRTTQTPPLIIAVSMDRSDILAAWQHNAWQALTVLGVGAVLLGVVLVILFRQMDARTGVERAFGEVQQRERERLREANERLAGALDRERAAREEAEAASALKDDFLMTVSHELRTPLTAIYGWARILNRGGVGDRQRAMALHTIERNAEAQTHLIEDLLDASGVLTGKLRLDVYPIDLTEVVQGATQTVMPAAQAKSIQIECATGGQPMMVKGDAARLQQIVWNLLSNAVKFTPAGGTVRIVLERDGGDMVVRVTDSGIGMSRDFLPHVFDRFRQEESGTMRRFGGLGLGLAIVRSLVELHGGTVAADSAGPNLGSTFTVRLPAMKAGADRQPQRPPASATPVNLEGVRVLIVDDDPEARELFAVVLTGVGATVTTAASAGEALARVREGVFDVLVSDIEMPDVDGYVLGREAIAVARERGLALTAIAVTAYSRPEDEARSLAAGFARHLSKPIDPADLVAAVGMAAGGTPTQQFAN